MTSRITQSLSFHQSPDQFISQRLQQFAHSSAQQARSNGAPPIVRGEILNRNVHIISSYNLCKAILEHSVRDLSKSQSLAPLVQTTESDGDESMPPTFAAGSAYEQLMVAFFPRPDILLEDGQQHSQARRRWEQAFTSIVADSVPLIRKVTLQRFVDPLQTPDETDNIDLYEALKALSWDLLFAVFLGLHRDDTKDDFRKLEELQEILLRGQFSLFPVPIRTPFWTSARSRGTQAVRDIAQIMARHVTSWTGTSTSNDPARPVCPFAAGLENAPVGDSAQLTDEEIVSHLRLFTSSIANKALASLLTATLLNVFLWKAPSRPRDNHSLADLLTAQSDTVVRDAMLHSVVKETERLSPPVVGVMRRVTTPVAVTQPDGSSYTIPAGHDAWLYVAGANRDPSVFSDAEVFQWDRFMHSSSDTVDGGLTFGAGSKRCLGGNLAHQICLTVVQTVLDAKLTLHGDVKAEGVREWLGWQSGRTADAMARDLKQLPCQRPRRPVLVSAKQS